MQGCRGHLLLSPAVVEPTDLLLELLDLLLQNHLEPFQLGLQPLHPLLQARQCLLILILNTHSSLKF